MIYVDGELINLSTFPDGTQSLKYIPKLYSRRRITWLYDNDAECMAIWNIVHHIRASIPSSIIELNMPYIPNARMDRVKNSEDVFTLKYFAELINALRLDYVNVLDAHSNVSLGLINHVKDMFCINGVFNVCSVINNIDSQNTLLCYPDEGAAKRYSDILSFEYVFGIKHRNWETGAIESFALTSPEKIKDRPVLIVDDICSKGGTALHTAKALRQAGAKDVQLYITHCENTIFDGEILNTDLISHVYTTDSILRKEHDKITVFHVDI